MVKLINVTDVLAESGATRLVWDRETGQLVDPSILEAKRQQRDKRRTRQQADFLRGPIPMTWLERACQLPGRVANVAIAIWYVRGFKRPEPFPMKRATLARFGVHHREIYYRALAALERAGLIRITREPGQLLGVTVLLESPSADRAVRNSGQQGE